MTRFYRPVPARLTLRDALTHWREGLPMLAVFPAVFVAALILEICHV